MPRLPVRVVAPTVAALLLIVACAVDPAAPTRGSMESAASPKVAEPLREVDNAYVLASKVELPTSKGSDGHGLHNVFRLSDRVISGSEPEGETAFAELASMGVKTIVSVDGKAPDVELATKHGMRYVHVPVEYKGLTEEQVAELVKTYRECDGPFYTHCFHGKHRGPAAAAIGRLALDGISREQAIAEMRQWCGTAPEYEGLYRDVAMRTIPTVAQSRALEFDFPPQRGFTGFRAGMIDISRRDDALKNLAARDWKPDPAHPDLDALNEATKLAQNFEVSSKMSEVAGEPQEFHDDLAKSIALANELVTQLRAVRDGDAMQLDASKKSYASLARSCSACHTVYRNR
jgi:protein tyrosine phosphatase (PTP) superfamily phosphohydrolase (DUF442 family)